MTVTVLKSSNSGAPALTTTAGSLIAVLDFCLLTAGWTKEFSDTNLATYRPPAGNRLYFAVDDTTTTYARCRSFEEATAAGTAIASGSGPMPTDSQLSGGGYIIKGDSYAWQAYVSDRSFYLFTRSSSYYHAIFFGDLASPIVWDTYGVGLVANINSTAGTTSPPFTVVTSTTATAAGHYMQRSYTQVAGCVAAALYLPVYFCGEYIGYGGDTYPSRVESALRMSRAPYGELVGSTVIMRGCLPGLWIPGHNAPLSRLDTFSGSGDLAGRTFEVQGAGVNAIYQCFIETSDTWYS